MIGAGGTKSTAAGTKLAVEAPNQPRQGPNRWHWSLLAMHAPDRYVGVGSVGGAPSGPSTALPRRSSPCLCRLPVWPGRSHAGGGGQLEWRRRKKTYTENDMRGPPSA
jgi:hypothetical protein